MAEVAYEVGFRSLGPFNKAFKDATPKPPRSSGARGWGYRKRQKQSQQTNLLGTGLWRERLTTGNCSSVRTG